MTGSETHSTRNSQQKSSLWKRERSAQSSVWTAHWNSNLVSSHWISFGWLLHRSTQASPTTRLSNFFFFPLPTCVSWRSLLWFTWRTTGGHGSLLNRTCEWPFPQCHQGLKKSARPDRQNIYNSTCFNADCWNVTFIICSSGPCAASLHWQFSVLNFCWVSFASFFILWPVWFKWVCCCFDEA